MEDNKFVQFGYGAGYLLSMIFIILWKGIVTASIKYKELLYTYICLGIATIISLALFNTCFIVVLTIFVLAITFGIMEYTDKSSIGNRRKVFNALFQEIKLQANGRFPLYQYEKVISEYATLYAFQSLIPLHEWKNKKETMEMYLNSKIIDIKQDKKDNQIIYLYIQLKELPSEINWHYEYNNKNGNILYIGQGYYGLAGMDLEKYPHAFIAGESGSGKSIILKCMIYQSLIKNYEVILIDFKRGVSFTCFSGIKVYYDYPETMKVLEDMVEETKRRLDLFRENKVDNLKHYNNMAKNQLPRKIVYIDELAELLKIRDKEISNSLYDSIETLTRLSRAVGIHLIMGIQRPDSTIINGQIKNNVSFRVCGRFVDREPSRIMLSSDVASRIPNIKGRFIIKDDGLQDVQCFYYPKYYTFNVAESKKDNSISNSNITLTRQNMPKEEQKEVDGIKVSNELEFDFSDVK